MAQEAVAQPLEMEPSGSDYMRAIRLRGIDSEVAYFDPTGPAPALDTQQNPVAPPEDSDTSAGDIFDSNTRITTIVVTSVLLAAIGYLFIRYGGGISVSLRQQSQNPGRQRRGRRPDIHREGWKPGDLGSILNMRDRRMALVLLAQMALAKTVAANGVLLQPSWTARDALRRIPNGQPHLDALRDLVSAGERVQFGGRDVSEDEFDAQVSRIRPLIADAAA
jgi:hypothetical protein